MLTGIYPARVIATWLAESAKKKTPYVNLKFSVMDGDQEITNFLPIWISDKAIGMARKSLKLIGFDLEKESIYTLANGSTLLAGNEFEVEVFEEEYKGEMQTKYRIPMGDAPLSAESASKVDAMLKSKSEEKTETKVAKAPSAKKAMINEMMDQIAKAKPVEPDDSQAF